MIPALAISLRQAWPAMAAASDLASTVSASARRPTGHAIEFWVTVPPAASTFAAGWICLVARAANRWCHVAANPEAAARRRLAKGERRAPSRHISSWLWRRTGAGGWPSEALSLGEWMGGGALAGLTFGIGCYLL